MNWQDKTHIILLASGSIISHLVRQIPLVHIDGVIADLVRDRDELVELAGRRVAGQPDRLAVRGVVAAAVVLLLAGIDNRDAVREDGERDRVLGEGDVARVSAYFFFFLSLVNIMGYIQRI